MDFSEVLVAVMISLLLGGFAGCSIKEGFFVRDCRAIGAHVTSSTELKITCAVEKKQP